MYWNITRGQAKLNMHYQNSGLNSILCNIVFVSTVVGPVRNVIRD